MSEESNNMFVALGKLAFDIVVASSCSGVPEESNKQMSLYDCFTDISKDTQSGCSQSRMDLPTI